MDMKQFLRLVQGICAHILTIKAKKKVIQFSVHCSLDGSYYYSRSVL